MDESIYYQNFIDSMTACCGPKEQTFTTGFFYIWFLNIVFQEGVREVAYKNKVLVKNLTVMSPSLPNKIEDTPDTAPKTMFIITGLLWGNRFIEWLSYGWIGKRLNMQIHAAWNFHGQCGHTCVRLNQVLIISAVRIRLFSFRLTLFSKDFVWTRFL